MRVACAYIVAVGVALLVGWGVRDNHPLVVVAIADIAGTAVICLFSRLYNNTSVYDPYWSVAPVPIALYLATVGTGGGWPSLRAVVVCAVVVVWGGRLTYNWVRRWPGLHHEDWRYAALRPRAGRLFWPASFVGFQFFPTLIVLVGCLPLLPALSATTTPVGILDAVALLVTLGAVAVEARADTELHRFLSSKPPSGTLLEHGLWRYSRHPNYFGEVGFWWGLYLCGLAAAPLRDHWWSIAGPLTITALFLIVSIPMIERRALLRYPHYAERIRRTSPLVPWPPKKS